VKGIVCKICGYIAINGKTPDKCPVCSKPGTEFAEKADAIKTAADPKNMNDSEKKHVPSFLVVKQCGLIPGGCIDVHIKVGTVIHVMQPEHFIGHIDSYIDGEFVSRTSFPSDKLNPATVLHVKAGGCKISAVEWCNMHGAWIGETTV